MGQNKWQVSLDVAENSPKTTKETKQVKHEIREPRRHEQDCLESLLCALLAQKKSFSLQSSA